MNNGPILFLDQSGQLGGAELCLADLAAAYPNDGETLLLSPGPFEDFLTARGLEVRVFPLPGSLSRLTKAAGVMAFLRAAPELLGFFLGLRRRLQGARTLYFNTAKALLLGVVASALGGQRRIFHLHDLLVRKHFSALNIRLLVAAANRCDHIIANSEATAAAFRVAGGRVPVTVVPNGFDAAPFDAVTEAEARAVRESISPSSALLVGIFGRLAPWKGQHVVLEAVRSLPDIEVCIVGEPLFTEEDRAYAESLRALARKLTGRVHFLGFRQDIPAVMRAVDIVVHASTAEEPFGRVIVEGMLAGKPVIATRGGGPSEIIDDGRTGFLTEPGNADALSEILRQLANSPEWRREIGASGRNQASREYSLPLVRSKICEVIEHCR